MLLPRHVHVSVGIHFWLIIHLFKLHSPTSDTGAMVATCVLCLLSTVTCTVITFNSAFSLGAKLYHTRYKFAARLSTTSTDERPAADDEDHFGDWFATLSNQQMQASLDRYVTQREAVASPEDFKHFLLSETTSKTLSYITQQHAERLFQDWVDNRVQERLSQPLEGQKKAKPYPMSEFEA